ncbi:oligosaccharide flippase family protein [Aquimarina mytili]|uniref:Oligosaccharide flippase family protein n=1 Tax=Aquimarina mytili TaxID=874423 RepID=A0A937D932_9FLAO|nr:oligosaccharide flippase family protein [Aquimarina mytili]
MFETIKKNHFLKNIAIFFSGSLIALVAAVSVQFFIPKILSVEDYGLYKSFTLYLSYTSLLHFGLKDGIYIALCTQEAFIKQENIKYFSTLITQQFIVLILMLSGAFFFETPLKIILICLSITSFFFIINTYYDSLFQSQKKFKTVSFLKIFKETSFLILVVLVYFLFDKPSINIILGCFLLSIITSYFVYTYVSRKWIGLKTIGASDIEFIKPTYYRGIKLLAGNFGNQVNTNIDKLFINFFYSIELFAYYSFGGMFFVLTNTFVSSVSTVLLPYLFKDYNQDLDNKHRQLMKVTTMFSPVLFFYLIVVFYFVEYFYQNYIESITIIALFYVAMVYNIKINIVQNNYLKTLNLDKEYVRNNYIVLFGYILIMTMLYLLKMEIVYFAICTSMMMYFRFRLNLRCINSRLKINKNYFLDDFLIFILGILVFLYAKYVL